MTPATARGQKPTDGRRARRRAGTSRDTRPASILSPSRLRLAGSSVNAAASAHSTTRIAPAARLRKIVVGTINSPTSATTTVMPENSTARLAVDPARSIASSFSAAGRPLLAVARDDEQHVVDADREAHHRDHVRHEERQLVGLADERGQRERDHDRDDREPDRQERRDERPEDQQQHDQRDRDADRLTLGKVGLRGLVDVVRDRRLRRSRAR